MPENKRIRPTVSVTPPTPRARPDRSVDYDRTAPPQAECSPFRGRNRPRPYAASAQVHPNRSITIVDKVALAMTCAAPLNDEAHEPARLQGRARFSRSFTGPATQPCADLRACGRGLPAASMAAACGYTCRRPRARSRWPSPTLLLLPRDDLVGPERQRANGECWDNRGTTGSRALRLRPLVDILGRLTTRSKSYALGERITFTPEEFSEIAMACSRFGSELARKLPTLSAPN
jgi:hypothetical protein